MGNFSNTYFVVGVFVESRATSHLSVVDWPTTGGQHSHSPWNGLITSAQVCAQSASSQNVFLIFINHVYLSGCTRPKITFLWHFRGYTPNNVTVWYLPRNEIDQVQLEGGSLSQVQKLMTFVPQGKPKPVPTNVTTQIECRETNGCNSRAVTSWEKLLQ